MRLPNVLIGPKFGSVRKGVAVAPGTEATRAARPRAPREPFPRHFVLRLVSIWILWHDQRTCVGQSTRHGTFLADGSRVGKSRDSRCCGRIAALSKLCGGVLRIVSADIISRLVARTAAHRGREGHSTVSIRVDHQMWWRVYIQAMTNIDLRATVLSVDGIGSFDFILSSQMDGLPLLKRATKSFRSFANFKVFSS